MHGSLILANVPPFVFAVGGGVLALVLVFLAVRAGRRKRLVDNIPTSKTTGVFMGFVEVKGTAETETPFTSYLAANPCVWYAWKVEERWERTVTETSTDSEGKTTTRTRTESGWKTVAQGGQEQLFYLRDDEGVIRINPDKAKIEAKTVFNQTVRRSDPLYFGKCDAHEIANSDHRRRFTERAVPLHAPLYVIGQARERDDVIAPEIAYDKIAPMYLISTRNEEQISRGMGWQFWLLGALGVILASAGCMLMVHGQGAPLASHVGLFVGVGGAAAGLWLVGWFWMVYNSMIDLRQRVNQGWANVDVQLKRRHDLIPNLVGALEGLKQHEQSVLTDIAFLRSQASASAPGAEGADPQACAPKLMALKEAYPQLQSNQNFLQLQQALAETENRIALARGYYNEIASHYNMRLQVVPDRFISALARLQPRQYITADDFERAAVKVDLAE